ncbi:dihydrofolate reductase [Effusibacillus consociatus]|uniref:Dihydrofolate reductase n=1 Tax=Effusibacillus consociatus TaxID=1117041 RepID=A0ABV9QAQ7_9BACL
MTISMIVAMDSKRGIGKNNQLLWHIPEDLRYFKKVTTGKTVVMGRKTYESIGQPLPNRINIVLTKDMNFKPDGCLVFHSIEDLLSSKYAEEELFIVGGAEIYKLLLPMANKLYITRVEGNFDADTYFPEFDSHGWELVSTTDQAVDSNNPYEYRFEVYERKGL